MKAEAVIGRSVRAAAAGDVSVGQVFASYKRRLLACRFLEDLGSLVLPRTTYGVRVGVSALIIALTVYAVLWTLTALEGAAFAPIFVPTLLAAVTTAGALGAVGLLFPYTVRVLEENFDRFGVSEAAVIQIDGWLQDVTRPGDQLLFIAAASIGAVVLVVSIELSDVEPFPIYWSTYAAMVFAGVALSQGGYWAFVVPTCVGVIGRLGPDDLQIYRLNPSKSPSLTGFARVMNSYALTAALMCTLVLLTILALQPALSATGTWSMIIVLGIGYLSISYLFFVPHVALSRIVRREKVRTTRGLQERANSLLGKGQDLSEQEWAELDRIVELTSKLDSSKNTVIDLTGVRSYVASIATPTLTYIVSQAGWLAVVGKLG